MLMNRLRFPAAFCCAALACVQLQGSEPTPEAKTLMTERGKVLFADDFKQPPDKQWRVAKGKWEARDGILTAAQVPADMHAAVVRHTLSFHDAVIQFSFKLDGAKKTSLSINDDKGHICRVLIDTTGFILKKDSHDHNMTDKPAVLDKVDVPIKPGEWHTIVIEIQGKDMLACLDGKAVGFGSHPGIDVKLGNIGLTVAGQTVSFKNLTVWEALPNRTWEATRAKLLADRKATKAK